MKTFEIVQATIEAVSLVKKGANKRKFKILKSDGGFVREVRFSKSTEQQLVYGEVYIPMVPDTHGDYMTAENIEAMAQSFVASGRGASIDTEHDGKLNGSVVVESFIARKGDPDFTEGAWVLGVHVSDPALWQQIKAGEITGFSMAGRGVREEREITKSEDQMYDEDQARNRILLRQVSERHGAQQAQHPAEDLSWLVRKQDLDALERDAVRRVAAAKAFE